MITRLFLLFLPTVVLADTSVSDAANNLYQPISTLTMLMHWASYVVGASLCIGSIMQFRIHLQSPKLTPLFTPVFMLLLGIGLVLLPYFSSMPDASWNAEKQEPPATYNPNAADEDGTSEGHWSTRPQ
jgi:hypothetical protein